jgi:hypothetical protein
MTLRLLAACAALIATPALAAEPVVAKLQTPVAEKIRFIAGGAMFDCEADACVAAAPTADTSSTATCRAVAAKAGVVMAFTGRKALDAAKLAECNTAAKAAG